MRQRLVGVVAAVVRGEPPRRSPYDRVTLHRGEGNRWVMLAALLVLAKCALAVAWLLLGVLWGVVAVLSIVTATILVVEAEGGVRR